jgi:hypothetical protein
MNVRRKRMRTFKRALAIGLTASLLLGCQQAPGHDSSIAEIENLTQRNSQLREKLKTLEPLPAELELLRSELKEAKTEFARSEEERLALRVALRKTEAPSSKPAPATFTDLENCFAREQILELQELGVFGEPAEEFRPNEPISRAEYVTWAFKAYNAIQPDKRIHPAQSDLAAFKDVSADHPSFRYIQGLQDAGFVIGYDETTFKPDRHLSREEFVAIKTSIDGFTRAYGGYNEVPFADREQVSAKYRSCFLKENTNGLPNVRKAFGQIKTFQPQDSMTRAQAAASLWSFGGSWHETYTAEQAL